MAVPRVRIIARALIASALGCSVALGAAVPVAADNNNQLQHVRGTTGYESPPGTFHAVFGKADLADNALAVTRVSSAAVVALPDSSLVSLGENTSVTVGALVTAADGPGSTIQLNNGSLRFDIRRPEGARSNYRFVTTTSNVAVRGTVGLLSFLNNTTTVVCLACQADSVSVTVGNQTFTLLTGQMLTVTAAGAVTTTAVATSVMQAFSAASVPTSSAATTAAAGLPAASGAAAGAAASTTAGIVAGGAIGAAAIATVVSANSSPAPAASPTNGPTNAPTSTPTPAVTPTPTPSPTPTGQGGNVNLQGHTSAATPAPGAPATRAPAFAAPPPASLPGRLNR